MPGRGRVDEFTSRQDCGILRHMNDARSEDSQTPIPAAYARALLRRFGATPARRAELLAQTGLDEAALNAPGAEPPLHAVLELAARITRAEGEAWPLAAKSVWSNAMQGALDVAVRSAATFGAGAERARALRPHPRALSQHPPAIDEDKAAARTEAGGRARGAAVAGDRAGRRAERARVVRADLEEAAAETIVEIPVVGAEACVSNPRRIVLHGEIRPARFRNGISRESWDAVRRRSPMPRCTQARSRSLRTPRAAARGKLRSCATSSAWSSSICPGASARRRRRVSSAFPGAHWCAGSPRQA